MVKAKSVKQKLEAKLDKIDEINTTIYESKLRLNTLKPLNYYQNKTKEVLTEILRNQAKINQVIRSMAKSVYK